MICVYMKYCPECGCVDKVIIDTKVFSREEIKKILDREKTCGNCYSTVNINTLDNIINHNLNIDEIDTYQNTLVSSKLRHSMLRQIRQMIAQV